MLRLEAPLPVLVLALATLSVSIATSREATACMPPRTPETIPDVRLASGAAGGAASDVAVVPKNAGLVFSAMLGTLDEATARAKVAVDVRAGSDRIEGALRQVGSTQGQYVTWQWRPTAGTGLLPGPVGVVVNVDGKTIIDAAVMVEDRVVLPTARPLTLTLERVLESDPTAPKIMCREDDHEPSPGECGLGKGTSWELSTRAAPRAELRFALEGLSPLDQPYLVATSRIFGRSGTRLGETATSPTDHGSVTLDVDFEEYCADATLRSLVDGSEAESARVCVPNTLARRMSEEEEVRFVRRGLDLCPNAVFPEGTSRSDPTGTAGCAVSPGTRPGSGLLAALLASALVAAVVGRRRTRTRASREMPA